jgi:hypothetical protein
MSKLPQVQYIATTQLNLDGVVFQSLPLTRQPTEVLERTVLVVLTKGEEPAHDVDTARKQVLALEVVKVAGKTLETLITPRCV